MKLHQQILRYLLPPIGPYQYKQYYRFQKKDMEHGLLDVTKFSLKKRERKIKFLKYGNSVGQKVYSNGMDFIYTHLQSMYIYI